MQRTKGLTPEKAELIKKAFFDQGGFGSMAKTLKDVRKLEGGNQVRMEDIQQWFNKNRSQKTRRTGYNSYVAQGPKEEFQGDLFFINDLENQRYKIGFLLIDTFSKKMAVIPIASKEVGPVTAGIMEGVQELGGKWPKILYTDEEPAISSSGVQEFLESKGTRLVTTRNHAGVAERAIRTFKNMLYQRIEASEAKNPQWTDFIAPVLVTYNYKDVHSSIGMTPQEATKPQNRIDAKISMELKAKHRKKYPELSVGDKVRIFEKRRVGDKERKPIWSSEIFTIASTEIYMNQTFYKLKPRDGADEDTLSRRYSRFEVLKVSDD